MARLELIGVAKTYSGGVAGASGIDLTVEDRELFVIVGPSGSGKSTLLRLVAGLETLDSGAIQLDGRRIDGLRPSDRDLAMVFQDQVLYPHLNVFENIAFGLRARRVSGVEIEQRIGEVASALGLTDALGRGPETLSGGQRRRVALGRALVLRPKLFLLDEPFSGLDAPLRASTRSDLVELNRKLGTTMVLVTHDQSEALAVGDRVAVMERGRVVQVGSPVDLYDQPENRFVARFLGQPPMNLLRCKVDRSGDDLTIRLSGRDVGKAWAVPRATPWASMLAQDPESMIDLGIRPEHLSLRPEPPGPRFPQVSAGWAAIRRLEFLGHEGLAYLELGSEELIARLPARSPWRVGDRGWVGFDLDQAHWFQASTGRRLS